ncbi:FUSC family protein, partial [Streptomyces sp. MCAF7]
GMLTGAWLGTLWPGALWSGAWIALALAAVGLVSGAISAIGPVCSSAGVQLMVVCVVGSGMPAPEPPPVRAGLLLAGAAWVLTMAWLLPVFRGSVRLRTNLPDERRAVAAVYDALADLMAAVGTERGQAARRRLTAAYDAAYESLYGHRIPLHRPDAGLRRLRDLLAVAGALSETAVTLLWEGEPLPARVARTPALLARSVRTGRPPGPLP